MSANLPNNLESTRELLASSLKLHATEKAPIIPSDLVDDLTKHFNQQTAPASAPVSQSWFEAIQSFLSRPAFGLGALAVVIVGLGLPSIVGPGQKESGFRGAVSEPVLNQSARVFLIKASSEVAHMLSTSGEFEQGVISTVDRMDESTEGARVLVDFETSSIVVFDADGTEIHREAVPADSSELSAVIASALSRL